ncbi:MAG: fructosamine kinase family protein, partial [Bacteroidota bacterium]
SSNLLQSPIKSHTPLSGGDISKVYLLETSTQKLFLKTHQGILGKQMLSAEKIGLEHIANTKSIKTPQVYFLEEYQDTSLLVMEYIETKNPNSKDHKKLGFQLAEFHKNNTTEFGFDTNNFIGSLPQSNSKHNSWASFYVNERLLPQINLAKEKSLLSEKEIPNSEKLLNTCEKLFPIIKPSLLHGDLWGGNYLIATDGTPYLIDPAVYYGHSEVDLAMSRLFGGFSADFYKAYHEISSNLLGENERIDIYQLYYLLVHLNLFGKGYYRQVKWILDYYFS